MKLGVAKNKKKILVSGYNNSLVIHPMWLRERVTDAKYLDKNNGQRLYDPSKIKKNIKIERALIKNKFLNIKFSDGVQSDYIIKDLINEINKNSFQKSLKLWNSNIKYKPIYKYEKNLFNTKRGLKVIKDFYKFGFSIIKKTPVKKNYILNFANSLGILRKTNFGKLFNVRSVRKASDLAYTSHALAAHTDNPYRRPIPGIQILHCLKNDSIGGHSTLTDGFAVAEYMRKKFAKYFKILSTVKIRFSYQDKNTYLENWGETIQLDSDNTIKRVRLSPRLDYVQVFKKDKLDQFYKARSLFIKLCNSKKFMIEFKLSPGDMMLMDNYRTLHGRTKYDMSFGERHLQGCYIEHDSVESKMKKLEANS